MSIHQLNREGFPITMPFGAEEKFGLLLKCRCGYQEQVPFKTYRSTMATAFSRSRIQAKGWTIGKNRKKDLCPDCSSSVKAIEVASKHHQTTKPLESKMPTQAAIDNAIEASMSGEADTKPNPKPKTPKKDGRQSPKRVGVEHHIAIFKKLQEVVVDVADGKCSYAEGWTDRDVAAALGEPFKHHHVQYVRVKMFGELRNQPPPTMTKQYLYEAITALTKRVEELEKLYLEEITK